MTVSEFYAAVGGNYEEATARLMNDGLIRRFVLKFRDDKSYETLRLALTEHRTDDAFAAAHTLKGVALNLAFSRLGGSAAALTDVLRPQNRASFREEEADRLFAAVERDYGEVLCAIDALGT